MNRYLLTAKSLALPSSWIIRIGFAFGLFLSALMLCYRNEIGFSILAAVCSTGIAHNAYLLSRSERRRLVPGMNEVAARASILIALMMWCWLSLTTLELRGNAYDLIAFHLFLIAMGKWFGWGEPLVFWIMFVLAVMFAIACFSLGSSIVIQNIALEIFNRWSDGAWMLPRAIVAVGFLGTSCWMLRRYWTLATSTDEICSELRLQDLLEASVSTIFYTVKSAADDPNRQPEDRGEISKQSLTGRLENMLYGKVRLTLKGYAVTALLALIFVGMLLSFRGHDEATWGIQLVAAIFIVAVPLIAFVTRVPQTFSRLWILGIAEDRSKTARKILLIVLKRCLPWFAVFAIAIAIQSGTSVLGLTSNLLAFLITMAFSGGVLWLVVNWYPVWSRQSDVTILIGLLLFTLPIAFSALSFALLGVNAFAVYQSWCRETLSQFGIVPTLTIGVLTVVAIWAGCIYDAASRLGRSPRLME